MISNFVAKFCPNCKSEMVGIVKVSSSESEITCEDCDFVCIVRPSKAEREVATACESMFRADHGDILHCVRLKDHLLPHENGSWEWWDEAATPSLPEAVAGNASAPVGEPQLPDDSLVQPWLEQPDDRQPLPPSTTTPTADLRDFIGVREALELMVKELDWYAGKYGLGPARLQYALVRGRAALAAPAPVGEKRQPSGVQHGPSCEFIKDGKGTCGPDCRQPSGVGEPLREGDEVLARGKITKIGQAGTNDQGYVRVEFPEGGHYAWLKLAALSRPSPTEGASSPADAHTELVQKEVGEGLRERVETIQRELVWCMSSTPQGWLDRGYDERVVPWKAIAAALAAPAPKPAPPTMLREAAKSLLIECKGVLSLAEKELRAELGNTNVAVLKVKMADLEATLPCSCECWRCTSGGHCVRCDWNERKAAPKPAPPLSEEDVIAVLHDRATCKCQQTQQCALKQDTFVRRAAERKPPR